jgi:RNA polymerase sigma-70 factor (ECF subfamily)
MRTREEITEAVEAHADDVLRACAVYMREQADREDAFQETFLRFARSSATFEDVEHRKAWLIRVAVNVCKDMLKSAGRTRVVAMPEQEVADTSASDPLDATLDAVLRLPEKYKDVVYLHYYEGLKTDEIARTLGEKPSTVRNRLRDARGLLRKALGGEA